MRLYASLGARPENFFVFDKDGILHKGRPDVEEFKQKFCVDSKYKDYDLTKAMKDADVFVGLSVGNVVTPPMIKSMFSVCGAILISLSFLSGYEKPKWDNAIT